MTEEEVLQPVCQREIQIHWEVHDDGARFDPRRVGKQRGLCKIQRLARDDLKFHADLWKDLGSENWAWPYFCSPIYSEYFLFASTARRSISCREGELRK